MLRITELDADGRISARLEGKLVGPWVDEVRAVCQRAARAGRSITLDLAGVTFIDAVGARLIREWRQKGTSVVNGSPLVEELLKWEDCQCTRAGE